MKNPSISNFGSKSSVPEKQGNFRIIGLLSGLALCGGIIYGFIYFNQSQIKKIRMAEIKAEKSSTKEPIKSEDKIEENPKNNLNSKKSDIKKSVEEVFPNADLNDSATQYKVGKSYLNGQELQEDFAEAIKWFTLSASQGNKDAQLDLANLYYSGEKISQDYKKAFFFYKLAAEQKSADAAYSLAMMYEKGLGTMKNEEDATKWFKEASSLGHTEAQNYLNLRDVQSRTKLQQKSKESVIIPDDKSEIDKYLKSLDKKEKRKSEREIIWNN